MFGKTAQSGTQANISPGISFILRWARNVIQSGHLLSSTKITISKWTLINLVTKWKEGCVRGVGVTTEGNHPHRHSLFLPQPAAGSRHANLSCPHMFNPDNVWYPTDDTGCIQVASHFFLTLLQYKPSKWTTRQ
jgi:hypothetical protein